MLARQRQARIVDEVRRRGGVRVSDLTSLLDVSDMTVRRDLEELDRRGLVHKVHGGAVPATNSAEEPGFEAKSVRECPEKSALAVAAITLLSVMSIVLFYTLALLEHVLLPWARETR